ncbi:MAG: hypothetical protein R3A46_05825 [Thermomicrobiales bacterium]
MFEPAILDLLPGDRASLPALDRVQLAQDRITLVVFRRPAMPCRRSPVLG